MSLKSCNAAVLAECGRLPAYIDSQIKCLKYWLKLIELPNYRYAKKCYNMLRHFDNANKINWASHVKHLLCVNGYRYVWEQQTVGNKNVFIIQFKQRLIDQYFQDWHNTIQETSKLYLYRTIKLSYGLDKYTCVLNIRKFRHLYCSFKIGSLDLHIQSGRYNNIPREQRLCKLCTLEVEDEYHFLLKCPMYNELRNIYIPAKYITNPNHHKFVLLMTCKNEKIILNVANYIYMAYRERNTFLRNMIIE